MKKKGIVAVDRAIAVMYDLSGFENPVNLSRKSEYKEQLKKQI